MFQVIFSYSASLGQPRKRETILGKTTLRRDRLSLSLPKAFGSKTLILAVLHPCGARRSGAGGGHGGQGAALLCDHEVLREKPTLLHQGKQQEVCPVGVGGAWWVSHPTTNLPLPLLNAIK